MPDNYSRWLSALLALTATPEDAQSFQHRRYALASTVAHALVDDLPPAGHDQVVYAVWLTGHSAPAYFGSTTEARRRLWDLPVGESHHLANTFPPETWGRVQVLFWREALLACPARLEQLTLAMGDAQGVMPEEAVKLIGLALEYRFQVHFQPFFNLRKKRRDGSLRPINLNTSTSRAAKLSATMDSTFAILLPLWQVGLQAVAPATGIRTLIEHGIVVFPHGNPTDAI